mmetsp:Transcript_2954/g.3373  ORF Transcript_2954/g.3373 Transcript_2954/m.3373 type:complete len:204 (+) Transcript_2954:310-921(+)
MRFLSLLQKGTKQKGSMNMVAAQASSKRKRSWLSRKSKADAAMESPECSECDSYDDGMTLEQRDRELLKTLGNLSPKVISFFGDVRLLPEKARKVYGDMDRPLSEILAQQHAESMEKENINHAQKKLVKQILKQKPTDYDCFGDGKTLEQRDRELLETIGKNLSPKVISFFGDVRLLPEKARKICGDLDSCNRFEQSFVRVAV